MRRLLLVFLIGAAVLDVTQQAYTIDLVGSIAHRSAGTNVLAVIAASPIVATLERWGLFLLGFGALSLAMSLKKPTTPDAIGSRAPTRRP